MSNLLDGLATTLQTLIDGMTVSFTASGDSHTSTVKAFAWAPQDLDGHGPWAVIQLPSIQRTAVNAAETQLGSVDWWVSFPVEFYFELTKPAYSQAQAVNTIEAFINAVDADNSLGDPEIIDAKVTQVDLPLIIDDAPRVQINYPTVLELHRIV